LTRAVLLDRLLIGGIVFKDILTALKDILIASKISWDKVSGSRFWKSRFEWAGVSEMVVGREQSVSVNVVCKEDGLSMEKRE